MNIAVLSRGETLFSTQSLVKAAEKRNHSVEIIDPTYCSISIENRKPRLYYKEELIDDLDAIVPRIGASNTYYGSSVVRQFESMEVFSVVSSEGILLSRDKWACFQILARQGVPVPKTLFASIYDVEPQLNTFKGRPLIIKLLEGTHGEGVILSESPQNALSVIETLNAAGSKFVLQEYIEESNGTDIRAIVVDGVVVAAMKRSCKIGEFRSNLHRGGTSETVQMSKEEENAAIKAAKALKLGFCGVDIIQSKDGPLVLEINSSPGLEGIETTTGISVSKSVIGFIERNKRK